MLIELVRAAAATAPERPLIISPAGATTYGACLARAEAVARGLLARATDRFAVQLADPGELIAVLAGSTAVGAEACPYGATLDAVAVEDLAGRLDHPVVVTERPVRLAGATTVTVDELVSDEGDLPASVDAAPAMILTTGTTGQPKGARHDWRRLVDGERRRRGGPADARWLLAYNLHQFAGTQILLRVLADGATLVAPRSNQPADAIDAMRAHGVTHASATPTFWRFVTARLDESAASALPLRQITLGGEAIGEQVLADLRRLFPTARISQVYASTEFGSSVSVRDGRPGLPLSVLDRDETADVQFRIVDGQLEARSRIGMLGYYGDDTIDPDGWRPTGDLVEIEGDRIVFVGRATEVINVGGVKVHPLPIEEAVGTVPGVQLAHAYGKTNAVSGQVVAVDVVAADGVDPSELRARIRAGCGHLPDAARPRLIRVVPSIGVRGDKIDRRVTP